MNCKWTSNCPPPLPPLPIACQGAAAANWRMIIASQGLIFISPPFQTTLVCCHAQCIWAVDSEDRPSDDLADGWSMMTQVSSLSCAMCATISRTVALFRLQPTGSSRPPRLRLERHTRAKKASSDGPKGPNLDGDDGFGPFPG